MNEIINKDYLNDLSKIKETIKENQNKAMIVVNSAMIMTYYEIGTIINQRKTWGSKYIERLSNDLKEYGKGYSTQNLKFMVQLYNKFKDDLIGLQVASQIPWFTLVRIIGKSKSHEEMLWYINETHKRGWSRSMVLNQFALKAYESSLIEPISTDIIKSDDLTNELYKDTYVLDFIDKNKINNEKDLTKSLVDNIIKFLQELGPGFALVGKEYKLTTPTNKDFYIDLLMYNVIVHAYVVIEIKIDEFDPSYLGQLMFYVNAVDDLLKADIDNRTLGILLCKDSDNYVAKTSLNKANLKLWIAKYKFINELPTYLEKRLKEIDEE